jgi:hypothetical protein
MGLSTHYDTVNRAKNLGDFSYHLCQDTKLYNPNDLEDCDAERDEMIKLSTAGGIGNSLFVALTPLPLFWMFGFIILHFWRIQVVGFRNTVQWSTLNKRKKAWVGWCFIFSFFALLIALMSYLILIQEYRVPVSLGSRVMVTPVGNDYVAVKGTWTMEGLFNDTIMNPLQSSEIVCRKETGWCHESKAYVSDRHLGVETEDYVIVSWTTSSVVMKNELPCATELYTIDLNTKSVSGAGHYTNQNDANCKATWGAKRSNRREEWKLRMRDGFDVWQEEQKKARPYLMRLIQSLFGN